MLNDKDHENLADNEQTGAGAEPAQAEVSAQGEGPAQVAAAADPVLELPEIPEAAAQAEPVLPVQATEPPARNSGSGWKMFAAAVALVAMGAGVGSATTWSLSSKIQRSLTPIGYTGTPSVARPVAQSPAEGGSSVIPGIYKRVAPSVVAITVMAQRGFSRGQATGSGFVVDPRGYVLTNFHVVDGGQQITVKFVDGTQLDAKVVGSDRYQDIAVLKVDPGNRSLVAAALGDSDSVVVGELAIAIGSPFQQEFTVTSGIVSAIDRVVEEANNPFAIKGAIQTDAAINPGNSGGPLLNGNGEVIGINTLIDTGNTGINGNIGIGFALPINATKSILPRLIAGEKVQYPWIGVQMDTLTPDLIQQIGTDAQTGAVIRDVLPGSPAEKAGLKPATFNRRNQPVSADVVTAIDGQPVKSSGDLAKLVGAHKVGDKLTLTVVRAKEHLSLTVTLEARPDNVDQQPQPQQQP